MKEKKRGTLKWVIGGLALVISILIMLYPFISEYIFEHRQDSIIEVYEQEKADVPDTTLDDELEQARIYNQNLYSNHVQLQDPFKSENQEITENKYLNVLNLQGNGLMGYIRIPCIHVELPIYHGTSEAVLENGVGHLEGTSLPIGGESTHSVLTGHTGLNRAKLFTDLPQLEPGDQFYLYVLNEKLAYEVDQIVVVEPQEIEKLVIENGKDYCTLITCTPYGINTHRLFVRGHRIPYTEEAVAAAESKADTQAASVWMRQYVRAMLMGIVTIICILIAFEIWDRYKLKKNKDKEA